MQIECAVNQKINNSEVTSVVLLLSLHYNYKLGFLILVSFTVFILNIGESSFYSSGPRPGCLTHVTVCTESCFDGILTRRS